MDRIDQNGPNRLKWIEWTWMVCWYGLTIVL